MLTRANVGLAVILFSCLLSLPLMGWLYFFAPLIWTMMAAASFLALLWTCWKAPQGLIWPLIVALLSGVLALANTALVISYFSQGAGFNPQFFEHVTQESLAIALIDYRTPLFGLAAHLVVAMFCAYSLARSPRQRSTHIRPAIFGVIITALSCYPAWNFAVYVSQGATLKGYQSLFGNGFIYEVLAGVKRKNIILIYAEQLEQTYFNSELFPEKPLNDLEELYRNSLRFTNVSQVPGTSWTTAGIIASQCGFAVEGGIHFGNNSRLVAVEEPYPEATCLADVLQLSGYNTIFMGGASLRFGGKGQFLRTHGFDRAWGLEELQQYMADPLKRSNWNLEELQSYIADPARRSTWGLYDEDLLAMVKAEVARLEANEEPYLLSLLTLTTHHPSGVLTPQCNALPLSKDPMLAALQCTDRLLTQFVHDLLAMTNPEDTIVAVVSDHLAMRNTVYDRLVLREEGRRLLFFMPGQQPKTVSKQMSHFDVGATLLEAVGYPPTVRLGFGRSFLSGDYDGRKIGAIAKVLGPRPKSRISNPELLSANVFASGLIIDPRANQLTIGDAQFSIADTEGPMRSGYFLVVVDEFGGVFDLVFTRDLKRLAPHLNGKLVIALHRSAQAEPFSLRFGQINQNGEVSGTHEVIVELKMLDGSVLQDIARERTTH